MLLGSLEGPLRTKTVNMQWNQLTLLLQQNHKIYQSLSKKKKKKAKKPSGSMVDLEICKGCWIGEKKKGSRDMGY